MSEIGDNEQRFNIEEAKKEYSKQMEEGEKPDKIREAREEYIKQMESSEISSKENINPNQNIDKVVTSRGSVYSYLEDGRTQRFKTATKELNEPQDVLVYIPPYESLIKRDYWSKYLKDKNINSSEDYENKLIQYTRIGKTILVTNEDGDELGTNQSIYQSREEGKPPFIQLIDKSGSGKTTDFYFPVSPTPKIGWLTFDSRRYTDKESGKQLHEKHIGNAVVEIHERNNQ